MDNDSHRAKLCNPLIDRKVNIVVSKRIGQRRRDLSHAARNQDDDEEDDRRPIGLEAAQRVCVEQIIDVLQDIQCVDCEPERWKASERA